AVNDVAFSPDGRSIATASSDTTVRVWTSAIGQALAVLHGHGGIVTSVIFETPDRLVTVGADSSVRIWDAGTAPDLKVIARQRKPFVSAVRRTHEIDVLGAGGAVHVLDPQARHVLAVRAGATSDHANPKVARFGALVAHASGDSVLIFRDGRLVRRLQDLSSSPILKAANISVLRFS